MRTSEITYETSDQHAVPIHAHTDVALKIPGPKFRRENTGTHVHME
jgi:hypothetical protein